MKKEIRIIGYIFFITIGIQIQLFGQTTGLWHKGYCELELGKDFWSVKQLLENKPSEGEEKALRNDQLLYKVKLTEKNTMISWE